MDMQAKAKVLLLALALTVAGAASLAAADDHDGRPDHNGRPGHGGPPDHGGRPDRDKQKGGPSIYVNPEIYLDRRTKPDVDAPDFVMAELERCRASGVLSFVDCLRPNHRPVMIRRLEACVRSETIPDDPREITACLPPARVR